MKNRTLFCAAIAACLLFGLGSLEIFAQYTAPASNDVPSYLRISRNFSGLQRLLEDKKQLRDLRYYDYYLYALAPVETPSITITPYYSSRRTPASAPLEADATVIWMFGGSTMQNLETSDDLSIANTVAKTFSADGTGVRVENFGVGSFQSSLELVRFSRLLAVVPEREIPAIAIFYDGFNDPWHGYSFGAGAIQYDLSAKIAALVERKHLTAGLYATSAWLAEHSAAWTSIVHNRLQLALFSSHPDASESNLAKTVQIYVRNVAAADAICQAHKITCFFVLQPLAVTKMPATDEEHAAIDDMGTIGVGFVRDFYDRVVIELGSKRNFIDASHILDGRTEDDFFDLGHTGALTSPIIGESIAKLIIARMPPSTTAAHKTSSGH